MSVSEQQDWSSPSIYGRAVIAEPRLYTEADPIPPLLIGDGAGGLDALLDDEQSRWSSPTYVGRRRYRPDTAPAPGPAPGSAGTPGGNAAGALTIETGGSAGRSLLANSRTMAIASLTSRLTGFIRNIVLVGALGTLGVGDAYNSANSFPNMVYELLLGGVLSSVLIPLLVHAQDKDADGGDAYTQRLLSIAVAILGAATLFAVALAPYLAALFVDAGPQRQLTSIFATLLLPEIFFYGVGALFTAILNTRHVYGIGAWAPVVNNVITLATIAVFELLPGPTTLTPSSMTTAQILVVGIGTTLGIAGQALILLPALHRAGFHWAWRFRGQPHEAGRLREAGSLAGWVLGYVVASQIGVTVVLKVANDHHGVTIFTNADLLFQMPYGIIGVSLLTALMPRMSRAAARLDTAAVIEDLSLGARLSAVALVPITAGLIVLGPQFTTVFFAHGQTTIAQAHQLGLNLALAAFGLLPFALVMLQLRVFYAMRNGRTPTLINVFMVGTKVVLIIVAARTMANTHVVEALNVATSASYVVGAIVGHVLLTRRFGRLGFTRVARTVSLLALASLAGGLVAWGVARGCADALGDGRWAALASLLGGTVACALVFAGLAWRLRIPEVAELVAALGRGSPSKTGESADA
jgi:putative peptidoglycan lipid II flippase